MSIKFSVLTGVLMKKVNFIQKNVLFVGTNETVVGYILVSVLSGYL